MTAVKNSSESSVPKSQPLKDIRLSGRKSLGTVTIISSKLPHAFSGGQGMITSPHHVWYFSVLHEENLIILSSSLSPWTSVRSSH